MNEEEREALILYISLVTNPQPQFIAELENMVSSDVHSMDPFLLVYGAIVPKASPQLQQRMVLFITSRLPEAETNSTSLIHHILSLGNSGSPHASDYLIDYLGHPETDIQLVAVFAMRFLMDQPSVVKSLKDAVSQPDITEDHLIMIAKSLLYGCEGASMEDKVKPFPKDLVVTLVALSLGVDNKELDSTLTKYIQAVKTKDSMDLLNLMKISRVGQHNGKYVNETRLRRGSQWDESNSDYDLVASLAERRRDVQLYQNRRAYIWGKKFGVKDINAQVAGGAFVGVSNAGDYKLFGRGIARLQCYNRDRTILDFLVLRQKDSSSTQSKLYGVVLGRTLLNEQYTQDSRICENIPKELTSRKYTVFDFTYSVFVVVGNLNFRLQANLEFSGGLYLNFCENRGSLTAAVGLSPEIAISVAASGDLEVVVIKPFRCVFKIFLSLLVIVIKVHYFASTFLPYN